MTESLRVKGLSQMFNGTKALDNLGFSLSTGARLAVLGPSGSGKTTLLRLLAGLEAPSAGEIRVQGKVASRAGEILIAPERREVALVFQGLALFPQMNALEQIGFAARGRGGIGQAKKLLESVGLGHRVSARLDELSGGERQRIALARALAQEPKTILMDEPFASLDDEKRAEMRGLLRALLQERDATLILVTHSRDDAFSLAQHVLVLERGQAKGFGTLECLLMRPRSAAVVRALGLGEIVEGEIVSTGVAETAFGRVSAATEATAGMVRLLVRPGQPRIVSGPEGVEAEVISVEVRSVELREIRRVAVLRAGGKLLQMVLPSEGLIAGERIRLRIEGECEPIDD